MRCPLEGGDNENKLKIVCALGQWDFTAGCATRHVCEQVGVMRSSLHIAWVVKIEHFSVYPLCCIRELIFGCSFTPPPL